MMRLAKPLRPNERSLKRTENGSTCLCLCAMAPSRALKLWITETLDHHATRDRKNLPFGCRLQELAVASGYPEESRDRATPPRASLLGRYCGSRRRRVVARCIRDCR